MAKYVGKRVVPKHCGAWTKNKEYEMLSIVLDEASGESYISRRVVPAGTLLTDEYYWSICSLFSQQIADMGEEFEERQQAISQNNAETLRQIRADNDATESAIRQDNDATEQAVRDDNTATKAHVDAAVARSLADMEEAVSNVNSTNAALNARMDGIAGQATSDTEVLDARTDSDGTTHANLGEHIRKADGDIRNILDYGKALVSVPDEIRQKNLIEVIDAGVNGNDGTVVCRSECYGIADRAGVVVNGHLGESHGATTLRFTKPLELEAGKTYTILIDDPQRTGAANIYFYVENGGAVMKEDGVNKGFSLLSSRITQFIPDASGRYVAGLYCHGYEFDEYGFHIYVLEGAFAETDFVTFPTYAELRREAAAIVSVSDYARDNNIVQMRNNTVTDTATGEVLITAKAEGPLDPGAVILNGSLGPNNTVIRISEDLDLEEGETYTIYVDDENSGKNYNVLLSNYGGSGMMENDAVLYFNLQDNPYYQFVVPDAQKYHVRVHTSIENTFEDQPLHVYILKGVVPLESIRSFSGYEEECAKAAIASAASATRAQVRDDIREQSLLAVRARVYNDTNGQFVIRSRADKDADRTAVLFDGSLGDAIHVTTFAFTEYAEFEAGQEYTVYAQDDRQTIDYSIYFYKKGGGVMQQGGINTGRSVITTPLWYITPDADGEYRAGIYCHEGVFENHPFRLVVLKGHYTLQEIREGITLDEYLETASAMVLVSPEILKDNLIICRTAIAVDLQGQRVFTSFPMNRLDNAGMTMDGTLGPTVQKNNAILSENIMLEAGQPYTFYLDTDKTLDYQMWFARVSDSTTITMNGAAINFNAKTGPYGVFIPDTDDTVALRIRVPRDMEFNGHKVHAYLVKGRKSLNQIHSMATVRMLEESASGIRKELAAEENQTVSDAACFNAHAAKAMKVSDAMRRQNLVKMALLNRVVNGEIVHTCEPLGRYDQAGAIVNGSLNATDGHSVMYLSEFFNLEAGEPYTVFIDSSDQSVAYAMYFYLGSAGTAVQENGVNRGFSVRGEPFGCFIPDTGGQCRVGFYSSNAVLDHQEVHVYVVKGRHSRSEFLGSADGPEIAESVSSMARVKDWVRRENLVTCGSRCQSDANWEYTIKAAPVGAHDRAGVILDGEFGSEIGMATFRFSEPFHVEAGKTYTVLMTDEDPEANFQVLFVNYPSMMAMRENGTVRYFHVKNKPYGFINPEQDGDIIATAQLSGHGEFTHHMFHFYVLEGVYGESEMLSEVAAEKEPNYEVYGLPVLKLTGSMDGVAKENSGTFDYVYGDLSGTCTMKWQGASSLSYPKKNFTIKFNQKFEAKEGWGERKKYVLKANYVDFSHARNIVCARLWGQVVKSRHTRNERLNDLPNGGAIDGFPIIMLLNGEYYGLYTFNLPKDEDLFGIGESTTDPETGEVTLLNQAVFCADNHTAATQFKAHCVVDETDFSYKYVPNEEDFQWAKDSLDNLIDACLAAESEADVDALADKVDLDSALDYLIFTVLLAGSDMTDKNYIISTYDGVQWFFTAYDMDSVFGNHWTGKYYNSSDMNPTIKSYANGHQLMKLFRTYKRTDIKARYAELRSGVMSEQNVALAFENFMVDIPRAILNKEVERWPLIPGTNTNNLAQILDWYRLRCIKIDAEVEAL